jgi:conjugative transfer region protein TrbK
MRSVTKIALGAGVGGLMLAVAIASARREPPRAIVVPAPREIAPRIAEATPARCRTITMPDSGCDAAWEARRRHFFGEEQVR